MSFLRQSFPIFQHSTFLDTAHKAAVPNQVTEAVKNFYQDVQETGGDKVIWHPEVARVRGLCAKLIGAESTDIAFVKNTSDGLNFLANGVDFQPGDNVIVSDQEHVNNLFPWTNLERKQVEVRKIQSTNWTYGLHNIASLVDNKTRVISLSHVCAATGFRPPVEEIGEFCRKHGILFFLDAIQSIGLLDIDVTQLAVDALATSGHKWLFGPYGVGFLYCRKSIIAQLTPVFSAKMYTFTDAEKTNTSSYDDARRWEIGSPNYSGIYGLGAAVEMIHSVGTKAAENYVGDLCKDLRKKLTALGLEVVTPDEGRITGIISFHVTNPEEVSSALKAAKIFVSVRGQGFVRVSVHMFNNDEDIKHLVDNLKNLV